MSAVKIVCVPSARMTAVPFSSSHGVRTCCAAAKPVSPSDAYTVYRPSSVMRMSARPSPVTSMNRTFGSDQSSDGSAANRRKGSKSASAVRSKKPASGSSSDTTSRRPLADRSISRTPDRSLREGKAATVSSGPRRARAADVPSGCGTRFQALRFRL